MLGNEKHLSSPSLGFLGHLYFSFSTNTDVHFCPVPSPGLTDLGRPSDTGLGSLDDETQSSCAQSLCFREVSCFHPVLVCPLFPEVFLIYIFFTSSLERIRKLPNMRTVGVLEAWTGVSWKWRSWVLFLAVEKSCSTSQAPFLKGMERLPGLVVCPPDCKPSLWAW